MKRLFVLWFIMLAAAGAVAADKPNIIFVLADDLGFGDVGAFYQNARKEMQPSFRTPQMDRLIQEGVWLRRHYTSTPVCAPARASLMTGRDQGHCAIRDNMFDQPIPETHTLGTVLQAAGYYTAAVGKWGIGGVKPPFSAHPMKRGFDEYYGIMKHITAHSHYPGNANGIYDGFNEVQEGLDNAYSTDLFIARSKKIIQERAATKQPFFLYLALTAPHAQLQVPTMPYPDGGGLNGGLTWPLNTREGKMDSWLHPTVVDADWPEAEKRHATMVRRVDDGLGDLVQLLKDLKIDQNTLIVFSSDNGPHDEMGKDGRFQQDPRFFDSWGPFDGIKRDLFEGGIRVPTFVWWPGRINGNRIMNDPSAFWDWLPTFAEIGGLPVPDRSNGISLLPVLTGEGSLPDRSLYFEYYHAKKYGDATAQIFDSKNINARNQMRALVHGSNKIVAYDVNGDVPDYRFYDVDQDPHEDRERASEHGWPIYQAMVKEITRRRISNPKAARPYDQEFASPVTGGPFSKGMAIQIQRGPFPWIPEPSGDDWVHQPLESVTWSKFNPGDAVQIRGLLKVEKSGRYRITPTKRWKTNVWLNRAQVVDGEVNRSGYKPVSHWVSLEAGFHSVEIAAIAPENARRITLFLEDESGTKKRLDKSLFLDASEKGTGEF